MLTGIYAILNLINNKIYIGQAVNIQKRWKNHRIMLQYEKHYNGYLQSAYNKNGKFAFIWYVLEICDEDKLTEREQYWMNFYNSYDREFGYNLAIIAGKSSMLGRTHSEETKQQYSIDRKGKIRGPEARAAIKAGWEKRKANGPVSEETKRKLSESHKNHIPTQATRIKRSISLTGNKNRLGKLTGKRSPEVIANVIEGKRKAKHRREKDLMWTW